MPQQLKPGSPLRVDLCVVGQGSTFRFQAIFTSVLVLPPAGAPGCPFHSCSQLRVSEGCMADSRALQAVLAHPQPKPHSSRVTVLPLAFEGVTSSNNSDSTVTHSSSSGELLKARQGSSPSSGPALPWENLHVTGWGRGQNSTETTGLRQVQQLPTHVCFSRGSLCSGSHRFDGCFRPFCSALSSLLYFFL